MIERISLRAVFEELDELIDADGQAKIFQQAAQIARLAEQGWQSGQAKLFGCLKPSRECVEIPPFENVRPVLNRFGGADNGTPHISGERQGRWEDWTNLATDAAGAAWLKNAIKARRRRPSAAELDRWMRDNVAQLKKRESLIDACREATGATHRAAKAAYQRLPEESKPGPGRPRRG